MPAWVVGFAENIFGGWVSASFGPTSMIGLIIAFALFVWIVIGWHRHQREAKKPGMASWYFIIPCFVVAALAIAAATYGIGLQRKDPALSQDQIDKISSPYIAQIDSLKQQLAARPGGPAALYANTASGARLEIGKAVGTIPRIVEDHGKNNTVIVGETNDGSVPLSAPIPLPWTGTEFSKLSNPELKKLALDTSSKMRWFAVDWNNGRSRTNHSDLESKFLDEFRGTGAALAEEILARQKIFPPYTFQMQVMYPLALQGHFAGPNPIADAAVFLEDRARMLPDE